MKKILYFSVIFSLIILMTPYCFAASPVEKQNPTEKTHNLELSGEVKNGVRVVEVKASRYKFKPDPIVVKLGEKVHIIVTSTDVTHGFVISEFKVNLVFNLGKAAAIEFVANKEGEFGIYCSVYCGPGHAHMRGKFIVVK